MERKDQQVDQAESRAEQRCFRTRFALAIQIALCLPRDAETVAVVRGVAMVALDRLGVTSAWIEDIRLALSEACTNVIDHAQPTDEYEIRLEVDDQRYVITVIDTGHGLDAAQLASGMPPADSERGRGLAIMRALVDSLDFRSEPEAGTIVRLVKAISVLPAAPLNRLRDQSPAAEPPSG